MPGSGRPRRPAARGPVVRQEESLVIEVQHLTKQYGRFTAVDDVTFRVDKGEILGFLGPNGAGKTTTMRILTGYMPATIGKAVIAGFDIFDQPLEAKRRIGYLPETPPLYPDMTVRDYLLFVGRIRGVASKALRAQIDTAMEKARVADVATRYCGKLSKGYKQRVGLAQAILHNPEVLILDEPTAGLDPKQIMETRDLIKGLAGDHTVILSTHILPEVAVTCGRVVIINKGRVVAEDTPDNLTHRLRGSAGLRVDVRGEAGPAADALARVAGVVSVRPLAGETGTASFAVEPVPGQDVRAELARALVGQGLDLLGLQQVGM